MTDEDFEKLEERPESVITGMVCPFGPSGGWGDAEDEFGKLYFAFPIWRDEGGTLHQDQLTVIGRVTEAELDAGMARIKAYALIRAKVRIGELPNYTCRQAALVELLEIDAADAELQDHAAKLQEPVTIESALLGTLSLDRGINWFEGTAKVGRQKVKVRLDLGREEDWEALLSVAEELWEEIEDWNQKAKQLADQELRSLKNSAWRQPSGRRVSAIEFKMRMRLESVMVGRGENFELWYHDGGLFFGHSIQVRGNLRQGLIGAQFHG